jgi:periplasmic copper chaperone A
MKKALALSAFLGALLLAPAAAAHVTANPTEAAADGYTMITFRVPHGCDDSPTTRLSIQIPDGVESVTPEIVPGWEVEVSADEKEVTWTGGPLPNHRFTDFGISMKMPNTPDETVYFPAVQTCEQGESAWVQIAAEGEPEPELPAPAVLLTAAAGGHGSSAGSDDPVSSGQEPATGDEETTAAAESAAAEDDDDALVWVAVALGAAGLLAGLGALGLVYARRPKHA